MTIFTITQKILEQHVRIWLQAGTVGAVSGVMISWLLAHSPYETNYISNYISGRPLTFPLLLILEGVIAWTPSARHVHRVVRMLGWITAFGLALTSIGLIGDCWIGQRHSVTLWRLGFLFDLIGSSLGLLSTTALGVALLRARYESQLASAALIGVIPLTIELAF